MSTRMRYFRVVQAAMSPVLLLLLSFTNAQDWGDWSDSYRLDYSYDTARPNGPANWGSVDGLGEWESYLSVFGVSNQCDDGNRPSPIYLDQRGSTQQTFACQDLHEPLPRQINSNVDCNRYGLTFAVTPYALKAYFPLTDEYCRRPTLTVSGRYDPYVLLWMEIHARSEHVVGGKRYDAEIQMVHAGVGRESGQLLTIGLLVDASAPDDDVEFEWMLQKWKETVQFEEEYCSNRRRNLRSLQHDLSKYIRHGNFSSYNSDIFTPTDSTPRNLQFNGSPCLTDKFGRGCEPLGPRRRMFPYNLWPSIWYYGYSGSLASPPCSKIVRWRVLDEPLLISRRQYKDLTFLLTQSRSDDCQFDTATDSNGENRRPVQVGNNNGVFQTIYRCTPDNFGHFVYSPDEQ